MRNRYTKELLEEALKDARSWRDVCKKVGIKPDTGAQAHLTKRAKFFGLTAPIGGQSWSKGKKFPPKRDVSFYLVKDCSVRITSHNLRNRLIKEKIKEHKCEVCALTIWQGKQIPLELDHINGDNTDNRLLNLRVLCPNCHAQTETYCQKKGV